MQSFAASMEHARACARYQDDLVIEKGDGFGSNAVVIGAEHSADEWRTRIGGIVRRTSAPSGSRVPVGAGVKGAQSGIRTASCLG